jgi:hypothetical protein
VDEGYVSVTPLHVDLTAHQAHMVADWLDRVGVATMVSKRVESLLNQLRTQGIVDERVLEAIALVPREKFVDEAFEQGVGKHGAAYRRGKPSRNPTWWRG